jgi:hypothetical protein
MTRSAPPPAQPRSAQAATARRTRDRSSPAARQASSDSASTHGGSGRPGGIRRSRSTRQNSALIHRHQAWARLVRAIRFVRIRTCGTTAEERIGRRHVHGTTMIS